MPAVIVITYPALARAASGVGKGGFDRAAIERFLQGANIRHVILDEVHKVAADLESPTAECVRVMLDWLHDGSLSSLIGSPGPCWGSRLSWPAWACRSPTCCRRPS